MRTDIECSICHEIIGFIDDENKIINTFIEDSNVKYEGNNIVANFIHCNVYQKAILK